MVDQGPADNPLHYVFLNEYGQSFVQEVEHKVVSLNAEVEELQGYLEKVQRMVSNGGSQEKMSSYLSFCIDASTKKRKQTEEVVQSPKKFKASRFVHLSHKSEAAFKNDFLNTVTSMEAIFKHFCISPTLHV